MERRIRPEPTPEERAAILAALERLLSEDARPPAYRSAWRDAGVRENLDNSGEDGDYGATARPRSSPGATRA
jgi:hypothetical protein